MKKILCAIIALMFLAGMAYGATATIILPVQAAKLPTSNAPGIDAGEGNWRLLFDDTTDESCRWQFRMPANYASGLTAKIQFSLAATAAGIDTVAFQVGVMAVTDGDAADIVTDSFDTTNDATLALENNQTAGYLREISITLTNADSLAAGDYVKIQINRDVSADDVVGDLEVVAVSIEFVTT